MGESDWLGARTVELSPLSLGADRSKVAEQLVATKIIELVVMGITNKRIRVDRAKYSYMCGMYYSRPTRNVVHVLYSSVIITFVRRYSMKVRKYESSTYSTFVVVLLYSSMYGSSTKVLSYFVLSYLRRYFRTK